MLLMDTSTLATPTDRYDPIGMGPLETRQAMLANGYEPLPLAGKAPVLNSWQFTAINEEAVLSWNNMGPNTGMRAARAPALDVDILD
jgi:hypothetical protein